MDVAHDVAHHPRRGSVRPTRVPRVVRARHELLKTSGSARKVCTMIRVNDVYRARHGTYLHIASTYTNRYVLYIYIYIYIYIIYTYICIQVWRREKRAHIFDPDKRNSKGFLSRLQSPGATTELLVPGLMELEYAKMRVARYLLLATFEQFLLNFSDFFQCLPTRVSRRTGG